MPTEIAPFLTKPGHFPKEFEGVKGERLRTVKLRGQISQGLILSQDIAADKIGAVLEGDDVTDLLGIKKYEKPLPAQLRGNTQGYFPSFIRKTDQERVQNLLRTLEKRKEEFPNEHFEVTLKVDGSSLTAYHKDGEVGVCSRNLELKTDESNAGNSFVDIFHHYKMAERLTKFGRNIAIQGEMYGEGVNGNWEGIQGREFRVFDIFDIDKQSYVDDAQRIDIVTEINSLSDAPLLKHVPIIEYITLEKFVTIDDYLNYADRPSIRNKIAEGVVLKSTIDPNFSFKVINNKYLLSGGE